MVGSVTLIQLLILCQGHTLYEYHRGPLSSWTLRPIYDLLYSQTRPKTSSPLQIRTELIPFNSIQRISSVTGSSLVPGSQSVPQPSFSEDSFPDSYILHHFQFDSSHVLRYMVLTWCLTLSSPQLFTPTFSRVRSHTCYFSSKKRPRLCRKFLEILTLTISRNRKQKSF